MALAVVLVLLVVGTVLFHVLSPWWFTPIASNWSMMDSTVNLTFWVTGAVVIVNLFVAAYRPLPHGRAAREYNPRTRSSSGGSTSRRRHRRCWRQASSSGPSS
jgi:cytochrome c oxidase subunit 2